MKRKIYIISFCILLISALTGCQLAQENEGINEKDRLIGVFITPERLNFYVFEESLFEVINKIRNFLGDGKIPTDDNTEKYPERYYATLETETITSEETGEAYEEEVYVFPIAGTLIDFVIEPETENHDSYPEFVNDSLINDVAVGINDMDDGERVTLTGTIYAAASNESRALYSFCPVYQSPDGSVYLTEGASISGQMDPGGMHFASTIKDPTTVTENGKSTTKSISITLSVGAIFAPEKIVVLQMDEENTLLSRTEYEPDAMPESISMEPKAAYLIVETHKRDYTGQIIISRTAYGGDDEYFETFFARDDGFCEGHSTYIEW